ncbi:MAG: hypothetical protein ACLUHJ_06725 [Ruminococcus sp.]
MSAGHARALRHSGSALQMDTAKRAADGKLTVRASRRSPQQGKSRKNGRCYARTAISRRSDQSGSRLGRRVRDLEE